jgi:hypothetical protein
MLTTAAETKDADRQVHVHAHCSELLATQQ